MQLFESLKNGKILTVFLGLCIIYAVITIIYLCKKKSNNKKWGKDNPNAVKVYVKNGLGFLFVTAVDDKKSRTFTEGVKRGFYLFPGEHVIEASYQKSRPGILHRTVTTTFGPSKNRVVAEANKSYEFRFDSKNKSFDFVELDSK